MLIVVAAFTVRVTYILTTTSHEPLTTDEAYFVANARSVTEGDAFKFSALPGAPAVENAAHPPLPALVLAPVAALTDNSNLAMRITVALAGSATIILIGLVARELTGRRAGLLAAAIAAVYPGLWANDGLVLSETFSALSTALVVLLTYQLISRPSWRNALGTGVACGLAMLSRSELVLLVPVVAIPAALLVRAVGRQRRLALAGLVALASIVTVGPWVGYNLARFEKPVLLTYPGGVMLGANCRSTYYGPLIGSWNGFCTIRSSSSDQSIVESAKQRRALSYMQAHLTRLPVVVAARVGRVWSAYRLSQIADYEAANGVPKWVTWTGWPVYLMLVALAAAGVTVLRRRGVAVLPILGPVVVVTLVAATLYGRPRFRVPAEISIVVLAGVALDAFVAQRLVRHRDERAA
jgi:4-amino-4-deoxy-L-arabinose transferase-like glycosyltransferase